MITRRLARALATAANPHSGIEELNDIVIDLIQFGAFDSADSVIRRLREQDWSPQTTKQLQELNDRARELGPDFEDWFLLKAIDTVNDDNATDEQLLRAAESLIVWGSLDQAERALERLQNSHGFLGRVARLSAASRQLRRSGILEELNTPDEDRSLEKPYEVLIKRRAGCKRLLIVFTGAERRFWMSLNVFHGFVRRLNTNVIYLADHSGRMYVNGVRALGDGYPALVSGLRAQIEEIGADEVYVMAVSAGGFVGLRAAMDLGATGYAGFSILTTLDPKDHAESGVFVWQVINDCRWPDMLVNLRPQLAASEFPRRIFLYCGDLNQGDRAHAENLMGIDRVDIRLLENFKPHNCVTGLLARGEFEPALRRLMRTPVEANAAAASG